MSWRTEGGSGLIAVVVILIAIGFGALYLFFKGDNHVVAVNHGTCTCDDYDDMKRRRAEAAAAEAAINNDVIPNVSPDEMFSGDAKTGNLPTIKAAIDSVPVAAGRTGEGETKPSCRSSIKAPTACLKAALQAHENVHVQYCDEYINKGGKGDYKEAKKMADYWREDAQGYAAEKAWLDYELNMLFNDMNCMHYSSYGGETRGDQEKRLAGAKRRVAGYAKSIS